MWNVTQQTFTHNRQHHVLGLKHRPGFGLWVDVSISCLCRCAQQFTQTSFSPFTYKSCLIISCLQIMFWLQVLSKDLPRTLHSLSGVWPCQLHIPSCLVPHYKPQLRFSGCSWLVGSWHKQGTPHEAGSAWDTGWSGSVTWGSHMPKQCTQRYVSTASANSTRGISFFRKKTRWRGDLYPPPDDQQPLLASYVMTWIPSVLNQRMLCPDP